MQLSESLWRNWSKGSETGIHSWNANGINWSNRFGLFEERSEKNKIVPRTKVSWDHMQQIRCHEKYLILNLACYSLFLRTSCILSSKIQYCMKGTLVMTQRSIFIFYFLLSVQIISPLWTSKCPLNQLDSGNNCN